MVAEDGSGPVKVPPVVLVKDAAVAPASGNSGVARGAREEEAGAPAPAPAPAEGKGVAAPHTPQVSSKHWRKIRSAVVALAAFRSRRVKAADFERIRMCGEGGSGLVYLVQLKNTTMFFALKVQRKTDLEAKEKRIRRALIEKEVLVACAHPFVCSLYTAFQDSRHLYLLMDYCAGGDLKTLVRDVAKRALTEEEARFYISEIVAALEWVHLHGYVYRDLKPENVLIHASGHIRLGDFGTAERGRFKCQDVPGEKLCPEEVEKALGETGMSHAATPDGTASGGHTFSEEEEGDLDESNNIHHGGGADNSNGPPHEAARANNSSIIVQIDPFLTEASASSVVPAADPTEEAEEEEEEEAASASAGAAPAAAADRVDRLVCADDGDDSAGPGGGCGPPVGCGCGRRRGRGKSAHGPASLSAGPGEPFAQGRGSVKLNVLLDSQTFIGTADFMAPEMVTGKTAQGTGMDWWALGVMLFEITLGTLPFHSELPSQSSNEVFRSIVNAELKFPRRHNLSRSAVDFIRQLLRKDPTERLGQRKGVGEIKRHPFFGSVHWALIANSTPPFVLSGPDTPGWLASMRSAPNAGARDDKFATWTWMATQQDAPRPGMQGTGGPAMTSSEAQDYLDYDSPSGRYSKADLDKLGDELGIAAGPTTDAEAAAEAAGGGAAAQPEGAGATSTTGEEKKNDNFDDSMPDISSGPVLKPSASASSAAAAGEGGGAGAGAARREGRRSNRASFDGYDFNTLRKVGSLRMGVSSNQGGAPKLAAGRSMDAQGNKPP
ncbi:protein kinase [Ectocarpus siliculosus]|uniref:non-specific serine/threonine protein kinase n=1 Tax=Ectocarpus siliculosus TaxID=2880 RepID=D8LSA2_ECTSI|nr:protein kinase [Ectocarpus siliculosus]|eukprot:CBN75159.1 protein kinase [Ectocarpus siliculosus]